MIGTTTGRRGRSSVRAALALWVLVAITACGVVSAPGAVEPDPRCVPGQGCPAFADEFDGRSGTAPDPDKWVVETGGLGWGGGTELQAYTKNSANVSIDGQGHLAITAHRESGAGGADYTSARLSTSGRFAFLHGRAEARVKLPAGQGLWSAFWLVGDHGPWPDHGEIDVVEGLNDVDRVHFDTHQPSDSNPAGWQPWLTSPVAPSGSWSDAFHVYAVDWTDQTITWSIDGRTYATLDRKDTPSDGRWVLDRSPQIIVLNLAIGGWPGSPDDSTTFPATMLVDYVRVWSASVQIGN
jgi:beta-glucanase (GH16 family)